MRVLAVPASPAPIHAITIDGGQIIVTLHGDEDGAWFEDSDGRFMVRDGAFLRYGSETERRQTMRACKQQRDMRKQLQLKSAFPRKGTVRVPVLLAEFADRKFTVTQPVERFTRLFNETHYNFNGSTGSVQDYYLASSNGALTLVFDVYGPYTLSQNEEYYGGNSGSSTTKNAQELVKEAARLAEADGVNFALYDNTGSGTVDHLSVITAGYNEAEGGSENCIWPHQSYVSNNTRASGKLLSSYLMISELRGNSGVKMANIGTYCHEFGHVLGIPDLYDTDKDDKSYTVGTWDLMCSGSYNNSSRTPPSYSAFERFMMGWLVPQQLSKAQLVTLDPIVTGNTALLVAASTHNLNPDNPSPAEYFMLENRQRQGWDSADNCLPGTGLLVAHITFSSSKWNNNTFNASQPLGYDIVEANNPQPTQSTASDTYPGAANVTTCMPTLNSGTPLSQYELTNIIERKDKKVSFVFGDVIDRPLTLNPNTLDTFITTFSNKVEQYYEQTVQITGKGLHAKAVLIGVKGSFALSLDGSDWGRTQEGFLDSVAEDGSYNRLLHIRHHPTRQSCSAASGQLTVFSMDSTAYTLTSLHGISPRPVYITAVDSVYTYLHTSSSFKVGWREVEDAESYYVTLYQQHVNRSDTTYKQLERREVVAPNHVALFELLPAGTQFKVTVEAAEHKSCFENIAEPATIMTYTLTERENSRVMPALLDDGRYVLITGEPQPDGARMAIYKEDGKFINEYPVQAGTFNPEIPVQDLEHGQLYCIKLYANVMKRRDLWAKFFYY
jgi:M6 family metalloprotease-like protein